MRILQLLKTEFFAHTHFPLLQSTHLHRALLLNCQVYWQKQSATSLNTDATRHTSIYSNSKLPTMNRQLAPMINRPVIGWQWVQHSSRSHATNCVWWKTTTGYNRRRLSASRWVQYRTHSCSNNRHTVTVATAEPHTNTTAQDSC